MAFMQVADALFFPAINLAPLLQIAVNLDHLALCSCTTSSVHEIISHPVVRVGNGHQNEVSS
jgi:hypothetical protein